MLIGDSSQRPSLQTVRRIKTTLHKVLDLPNDAVITVTQLVCLETSCSPLETVIGLLQPQLAERQYKIHKATDQVDVDDLICVCEAWGFSIPKNIITTVFKEI